MENVASTLDAHGIEVQKAECQARPFVIFVVLFFQAVTYHSGVSLKKRSENQRAFVRDQVKVRKSLPP